MPDPSRSRRRRLHAVAALGLTLVLHAACASTPPPALEDPATLTPARLEVEPGRLIVSGGAAGAPAVVAVEARSFADWNELAAFAESELGAEAVYGDDGQIREIGGELVETGEVVFRDADGSLFADREFVAAFLGGAGGRVTVGGRPIDLHGVAEHDLVPLAGTAQNCQGSDCVAGETWVTHFLGYHSVGGETRQVSGGTRTLSYLCCPAGGTLVTQAGRRRCRGLTPGAWEYDPELGRLVPKADFEGNPYRYSDPATCTSSVLANQLRLNVRMLFGPNQKDDLFFTKDNVPKLRFKRWKVGINIFDSENLEGITGICGFHSSNRGGSVRTSDGFTGDDGVLCGDPT